jgi:methionine salvage enolase-phosphatase E1
MIKAIISDFSRTLLFPKDTTYTGSLNQLYRDVKDKPGFSFFDYFVWNKDLEELYKGILLKDRIKTYIFTTDKIQEDPTMFPYTQTNFAGVFAVKDANGIAKDNPEAYKLLSFRIEVQTNEIVFVDDSDINLEAAKKAGINTIKYKNIPQVAVDLEKYISMSD